MRRFLAVMGAVLFGIPLALGPLAGAHENHLGFEWRTPADSAVAAGPVRITARVHFEDGVGRWTAEAGSPDGEPTPGNFRVICAGNAGGARSATVECDWDTTAYPDGSISRNGDYRLRVTAWNAGQAQPDRPAQSGRGSDESGQPEGSRRPAQSGRHRSARSRWPIPPRRRRAFAWPTTRAPPE